MKYLLDTNVLSEVRRPRPDPSVLAWLDAVAEDEVALSVVTIAELMRGIALMPEGARRGALTLWLDTDLRHRFGPRLLEIDDQTAQLWGRLSAQAHRGGRHLSAMDGWIAATALQHGLTLVTRNIRDFAFLDLSVLDPWET